MTVIELVLSVF